MFRQIVVLVIKAVKCSKLGHNLKRHKTLFNNGNFYKSNAL